MDCFLNQGMESVFRTSEINNPTMNWTGNDFCDLFNMGYTKVPYYREYKNGTNNHEYRRIFDLSRSGNFENISPNQPYGYAMRVRFHRKMLEAREMNEGEGHLLNRRQVPIHRDFPITWNDFVFIRPLRVNRFGESKNFYEMKYEDDSFNDVDEIVDYNQQITTNIKMEILSKAIDLQVNMTGFYKTFDGDKWDEDYIYEFCANDSSDLITYATDLLKTAEGHFSKTMVELSTSINQYYEDHHLNDWQYWINFRKKPHELFTHMRIYCSLKEKLTDISYRAVDILFHNHRHLMADHLLLLKNIIERYATKIYLIFIHFIGKNLLPDKKSDRGLPSRMPMRVRFAWIRAVNASTPSFQGVVIFGNFAIPAICRCSYVHKTVLDRQAGDAFLCSRCSAPTSYCKYRVLVNIQHFFVYKTCQREDTLITMKAQNFVMRIIILELIIGRSVLAGPDYH